MSFDEWHQTIFCNGRRTVTGVTTYLTNIKVDVGNKDKPLFIYFNVSVTKRHEYMKDSPIVSYHIYGLEQDCSNSSTLAMELL